MPRMERDPDSHALVFYPTPEEEAFNKLQEEHNELKSQFEELRTIVKNLQVPQKKKFK